MLGQNFTGYHASHIFPFAHLDLVWLPLRILLQLLVLCVFCFNLSFFVYSASIYHSLYILLKFLIYVSSNSISQWRSGQWGQIIEDDEPEENIGKSKIHSIQNGLLLSQLPHSYFDKYMIAINPNVTVFISI